MAGTPCLMGKGALLSVNSPQCLHVCVQGVLFLIGSGCLKFGAWYYCLGYNAF